MSIVLLILIWIGRGNMAHWLRLRYMIGIPVTSIARDMSLPIGIGMLPGVETIHARRIHWNPNIAWSEIIILAVHHADVFSTVPNVGLRNRRRRHHDRRRNNNRCCGYRPGIRQGKRTSHHCHGHDRRKNPFHILFLSLHGSLRRVRGMFRRRRASRFSAVRN